MCVARDGPAGRTAVLGQKGGDTGGKASPRGLVPLSEGMGREKAVSNWGLGQMKVIQMEWHTISVGWITKYILNKWIEKTSLLNQEHVNAQRCSHVLHIQHTWRGMLKSHPAFSPLPTTFGIVDIQQIFLNRQRDIKLKYLCNNCHFKLKGQ